MDTTDTTTRTQPAASAGSKEEENAVRVAAHVRVCREGGVILIIVFPVPQALQNLTALKHLPSGLIGKIRVHKSGKVK